MEYEHEEREGERERKKRWEWMMQKKVGCVMCWVEAHTYTHMLSREQFWNRPWNWKMMLFALQRSGWWNSSRTRDLREPEMKSTFRGIGCYFLTCRIDRFRMNLTRRMKTLHRGDVRWMRKMATLERASVAWKTRKSVDENYCCRHGIQSW